MEACFVGDLPTVQKYFEEHCLDSKEMDRALTYSANHIHLVEYLIDKGAHITPGALIHAIENDNEDMVQFFLDYLASDQRKKVVEVTYYSAAASKGKKYFDILEEYGYHNDQTFLKAAALHNNVEIAQTCLERITSNYNNFNDTIQNFDFLAALISFSLHGENEDIGLFIVEKLSSIYLKFFPHILEDRHLTSKEYWHHIFDSTMQDYYCAIIEVSDWYSSKYAHFKDLKFYDQKYHSVIFTPNQNASAVSELCHHKQ